MRFIFFVITIFMGPVLMAQEVDVPESEEGNVYLQGFAEAGFTTSINNVNANALRLNLLFGAGFNDWVFLGIGPGIRINRRLRSIPLYADIRIGNRAQKRAFYCAFGGGVSVGSRKTYELIGPAGHAEVGIRMNNKQKGGVIITIGYEVYSAEVTEIRGAGTYRYNSFELEDIQAITFGIGFSF